MILKILACLFLEGGSCLFGAWCIYGRRTRLLVLEDMIRILMTIKNQILYAAPSLDQIFSHLSEGRELSSFCKEVASSLEEGGNRRNMQKIWQDCVENHKKEWHLSGEEWKDWLEVGIYLGQVDKQEQMEQLNLSIELLHFHAQGVREGQAAYQRLVCSLSVVCGLMVILLMM